MQNRTAQQEMIVVEIDQVDLTTRVAHVFDKTRAPIQVSFRQAPGGIFHVPFKGEMWTAKRVGVQWYLDAKLDALTDHRWAVEHMQPGDTRIDAEGALHILADKLAFFGGTPHVKPAVTGSRGGNAALASLITALADLGLITDSTTP